MSEMNLADGLREISDEIAHDLAEDWRDRTANRIEDLPQGADGLEPYLSDVTVNDDGSAQFEIQHPTAPLHEYGGHIEPRYANAKLQGWSRDEFYEALTDCNEFVRRKMPVRGSIPEVVSGYQYNE